MRQVEIVEMHMQLFFGQSILYFGQNYKKTNKIIQSFARFLAVPSSDYNYYSHVLFAGNFGTVFVDQSYWQSAVAAKPRQGVWGFLFGGLVWFAVPFAFATTMGLSYIALSAHQGAPLLSDADVSAGTW